jgi:hypothetical protein
VPVRKLPKVPRDSALSVVSNLLIVLLGLAIGVGGPAIFLYFWSR